MEGNKQALDDMMQKASELLATNAPIIKDAYDNGMFFEAANMVDSMMNMLNTVGQALVALHVEEYGEADLDRRIMIERMKRNGSNN